jgi:hypothetical protein
MEGALVSDLYPQDSDAELNPTPPWPGNYEPPGWAFEREHGRAPDTDDEDDET